MAAEIKCGVSESPCNANEYGIVPGILFNILSSRLDDEIRLDLKLMQVSPSGLAQGRGSIH